MTHFDTEYCPRQSTRKGSWLRDVRVSAEDLKLLDREECTTQPRDRRILHSLIFEEQARRHDDQH
jgi:hypothetical protein